MGKQGSNSHLKTKRYTTERRLFLFGKLTTSHSSKPASMNNLDPSNSFVYELAKTFQGQSGSRIPAESPENDGWVVTSKKVIDFPVTHMNTE
jgi:hypothetical protein